MDKKYKSLEIKFYARPVVLPGQSDEKIKAHRAEVFSDKTGTDEDVIRELSNLTNQEFAEAERLHDLHLQAFSNVLRKHNKIFLKFYGLIYMSLRSQMMKGKRGVTANRIRGVSLLFKANKRIQKLFLNAHFIKVNVCLKGKKEAKKKTKSKKDHG